MNAIQELDKECLEQHIDSLISLIDTSKKLEENIKYVKESIQNYATENGVIYSDSSHSVSLVYSPKVEWDDEEIEECDLEIKDYEQQIKNLKYKQDQVKEKRKALISELQKEVKAKCLEEEKGINQIWGQFPFIKSLKDAFQVRISKSKISKETGNHESDFERSWIYKK